MMRHMKSKKDTQEDGAMIEFATSLCPCTFFFLGGGQTKMSWRSLLTSQYSR